MTAKAVEAAEDEQVILLKRITTIDELNEETLEAYNCCNFL